MNYPEHLTIGFIVGAAFIFVMHLVFSWFTFDIKSIVSLLVIIYVYSLLPDIDHPISKISWTFIGLGIILIGLGIIDTYVSFLPNGKTFLLAGAALLILTFVCAQWAGHRGPIHTIWAGVIFSVPLYFILGSWTFCLVGFVCFYSHLCADGEPFKI